MLGIAGSKPLAGVAEGEVMCESSKVFDFIGSKFFENYPKWCPQVVELERLSPPPVERGTKGRQVTRDRGIDSESTFEVSTYDLGKTFEISGVSEQFRSSYVVQPEARGRARVSFTFELKEIDLVMRPFQKLIKRALEEGAVQTVENIKRLLESGVIA